MQVELEWKIMANFNPNYILSPDINKPAGSDDFSPCDLLRFAKLPVLLLNTRIASNVG